MEDLFNLIKRVPFSFESFVVLLIAGSIKLVHDLVKDIKNKDLFSIFISILMLVLVSLLVPILISVMELPLKSIVMVSTLIGLLSGYFINALNNIGKRLESKSPDWFEMIIEGYIERKVNKKLEQDDKFYKE